MSKDVIKDLRPLVGGSYLLDEKTGKYKPLDVPAAPQPAAYEAPDPVDPKATPVVPPQVGGSYILDEATGDHTALFVPNSGMDGDGVPLEAAPEASDAASEPPADTSADPAQD